VELGPAAPGVTRFLSASVARNRSFELMYIKPLVFRPDFAPQLSYDCCWCNSREGGAEAPRSMEIFPTLLVSSCDEAEPLEEGREGRRRDLSPPEEMSRCGERVVLGAVKGEKPEGGFEVRMVGGLAGKSSRETFSSRSRPRVGDEKLPYSTPKLPVLGVVGTERLLPSKSDLAGSDMTDKLVIREEMSSGEAGWSWTRLSSSRFICCRVGS
jgi:hypothetical protein